MRISTLLLSISAAVGIGFCACSSPDTKQIEQGEAESADIETAIMQGRTAARSFLDADPSDTLALQDKLLEARAIQSKYVTAGQHDHAEAFDTAFIHTLRAAKPEVARAIEALH
ncbi:MAG: hypothetical protein HDS66_04560 [Bacteroidales bacterium]|nr:hypothetical protein [Bacteroidales bacterium]